MNSIKKVWSQISATPKTVREFGFILSGFLILFPLITKSIGVLFFSRPFHYWLGWPILGILAIMINLAAPSVMELVYHLAMLVAHGISWVVMQIVLGMLFYLVLTPISVTARLLGKDLLDEKIDPSAETYWKKRARKALPKQYERLF